MPTRDPSESQRSRIGLARETARSLIDALEIENKPIDQCLALAHRLARLLRDGDAERWLGYEARGYPPKLKASVLGSCGKYSYRFTDNEASFTESLPKLEARAAGTRMVLERMQGPAPALSTPVANYLESGATTSVLNNLHQMLVAAKNEYAIAHHNLCAVRSGLHHWAADTLIALEIGDAAQDIFEDARATVDKFIRQNCPDAAQQLLAVSERMREGDAESLSLALTTCRRLIATVADRLFPARNEVRMDLTGNPRRVDSEAYVNRLLAYVETKALAANSSDGSKVLIRAEMQHLASRLAAIYKKTSKGVHAGVSWEEARLVVIHTYLILAEVARTWTPADLAAPEPDLPVIPGALEQQAGSESS